MESEIKNSIIMEVYQYSDNNYVSSSSEEDISVKSDDVNNKYMVMDEINSCVLPSFVNQMNADVVYVKNVVDSTWSPKHILPEKAVEQLPAEKINKHSNIQFTSIVKAIVIDNNLADIRIGDETSTIIKPSGPASQICCSIFCNAINSNEVLLLLKDPLFIYGTVKVLPLVGTVEIHGYDALPGEELEIFSPKGFSGIKLFPTPNNEATENHIDKEFRRLKKCFLLDELQQLRAHYNIKQDALLLLKRNVNRKRIINTFTKYMSENVFPNTRTMQMERPLYSTEFQLRCVINSGDFDKAVIVPQQWLQLQLEKCCKLMVVGGKSVGKSTLLRYLINRHIRNFPQGVLFIDLDIGQPELFLPQTISCFVLTQPLLGPGFFLNLQPTKSYLIGHTNVMMCAQIYMRAVKQLLEFCRSHAIYSQLPWFVNTMGYNKGFGLELVATISSLLYPTDIIQLQSNRNINNFDIILHPLQLDSVSRSIYAREEFGSRTDKLNYRLFVFDSAVQQISRYRKDWDMSPRDMRYATMLARLSDALQDSEEWLTDSLVLCSPIDRLKVINLLNEECCDEELFKSIAGSIVHLCHLSECGLDAAVECIGIGIVRATDQFERLIYIVPAMPNYLLSTVNCLATGELPIPSSMFTNQGDRVIDKGAFVYDSEDIFLTKCVKQIYHRSPEFLSNSNKKLI